MRNEIIHIVCLDAPSPPDYGGVYDLYYKVPALAKLGYKVILHYFNYKSGRSANGLELFCKAIHRYQRKTFFSSIFSSLPYIVHSRINKKLIKNLNKDAAPVLLEGIHCTGLLPYINAGQRKVLVRMHNDEALYYAELATTETNFFKKKYLLRESESLKKYQATLPSELHYSFVAEIDQLNFQRKYGFYNSSFIPAFIPWKNVVGKLGKGKYCIYQGNLSISENVKAVEWLLENVFSYLDIPFIVSGKSPDKNLADKIKKYSNASLISSPTSEKLHTLIQDAHIHLLPSFNTTGVKLKLIHALFNGRFCITNHQGVAGSGITEGVMIAEDAFTYRSLIIQYMEIDFTLTDIEDRLYLRELFDSEMSAQKLSEFL